jgi:hypothetical protein
LLGYLDHTIIRNEKEKERWAKYIYMLIQYTRCTHTPQKSVIMLHSILFFFSFLPVLTFFLLTYLFWTSASILLAWVTSQPHCTQKTWKREVKIGSLGCTHDILLSQMLDWSASTAPRFKANPHPVNRI